jgi:hypothetical protein
MHLAGRGSFAIWERIMTLLKLVEKLDKLHEGDVIFAREKWTPESEAAVFRLTEDYKDGASFLFTR